jgi:hypothetical protein
MSASGAAADVIVYFDPADSVLAIGDSVPVEIRAEFEEPVMSWGLDLTVEDSAYADWTDTVIGDAWDDPGDTLDHDGLAGLRFDTGIGGDVLLATVTFEGLLEGETVLTLSMGPEEDEGFVLEAGGLASNVQFVPGSLTVVPEPAGLTLLAIGALTIRLRRR